MATTRRLRRCAKLLGIEDRRARKRVRRRQYGAVDAKIVEDAGGKACVRHAIESNRQIELARAQPLGVRHAWHFAHDDVDVRELFAHRRDRSDHPTAVDRDAAQSQAQRPKPAFVGEMRAGDRVGESRKERLDAAQERLARRKLCRFSLIDEDYARHWRRIL